MSTGRAPGPNTGPAHAVGTLADEAGQLLDAVAVRLRGMKAAAAGDGAAGSGITPPGPGPDLPPPDLPPPDLPPPLEPPDLAPPVVDVDPPVAEDEAHPAGVTHSCVGWCPICRSADLLQGDRPELTEKLVDAALLVVTTLRSLIPPVTAATAPRTAAGAPSGVERIDIR